MLLAQVQLAIVEEHSAAPVQENCAIHELLLHVVGVLEHLAQVVRVVQNGRLDAHFSVLD